ncbi:MAG: Fe-S cluster assembly protein SufD [Cyanobacteria bacterium P01_G01_bin.19]
MAVQIPFATVSQVNKTTVVEDVFLTGLLAQCQINEDEPQWLCDTRQQAKSWLSHLSVPSRRDEDWRFIDLADLTAGKFVAPASKKAFDKTPLQKTADNRLVFVNGTYNAELSDALALPKGIYVGNLKDLPQEHQAKEYFARQHGMQDAFASLNTAGGNDVAVIWASKNAVVETPIHLLFVTDGEQEATFTQPRILVVAESNSSFSWIEEYVGLGKYFTNAVTEIFLKANARVNHTRLQQESEASYHIGKTAISQARDSHYTINEINLGAKLFRHNPEVLQQGEQTVSNLNGLTVATGEQTSDTHSIIALSKPHGNTDQLHKCIVGDRAHTVFNGKVFVTKEAQLTDATQLNRNLMLSPKARVDTKPELQITADNVKCAHGATVSQLEADEIFYLRSRGLSENDANQLLIDAFAAEIIDRLQIESLKTRVNQAIEQKIK